MRISLKFYSCVGSNHTTLDAIRMMQARARRSAPDDIESIVVHGSQVTVEHVGWTYAPAGPHLGAIEPAVLRRDAAARRRCVRRSVQRRQVADPAADGAGRRRSACCTIPRSPRAVRTSATWCASKCSSKDGTTLEQTVEAPRGSETSFASEADIVGKFKKLATHAVSDAKAERVVNLVLGAEKLARAGQIAEALADG